MLVLVTATVALGVPAPAPAWPVQGKDIANARDGGSRAVGDERAHACGRLRFSAGNGDFTGTPVVAEGTVLVGSFGGTVSARHDDERAQVVADRHPAIAAGRRHRRDGSGIVSTKSESTACSSATPAKLARVAPAKGCLPTNARRTPGRAG